MNEYEAEKIAAAIHVARPDWPASSLLTMIRKNLIDRPRRDVFVALAWVASEPNTSTPARVLESGPWWRAVAVDGDTTGRREPFDASECCDVCNIPAARHPDQRNLPVEDRHEFVSVLDHTRRLPERDDGALKDRIDYARQALGDAKADGPREPEERPKHKPSPEVDRLRAELATATDPETTRAAMAAERSAT